MKKFKRTQPVNRDTFAAREAVEMQLHLEEVFTDIQDRSILDGQAIRDVSFTAGYINHVEHGMGKPVDCWFMSSNAQLVLYEDTSDDMDQNVYVSLVPSTTCTATLWVCAKE